jgi:hypothetical protein
MLDKGTRQGARLYTMSIYTTSLLPASYSLPGKSATDEEFEISDR